MNARRRSMLVSLAAIASLTAGCAALKPTGGGVHASRTGERDREAVPRIGSPSIDSADVMTEPRGTGRDPATAWPTANNEVRRVCRAAGWPRGWIPTSYVEAAGECPARSGVDAAYNAAVVVRFDHRPRGAQLEVCGDQVVPNGWVLVGDGSEAAAAACPGAGTDGTGRSLRIRRVAINERM